MSPTVSQGLILPRCEVKQMCYLGLICSFHSHYWCRFLSWEKEQRERFSTCLSTCIVCVRKRQVEGEGKGRKRWPCSLLIPPVIQPCWSLNPPLTERKRKWPNSNRKCCKVTSSSLQGGGDGMLLLIYVCVRTRVWQTERLLVCVGL